MTRCPLLNCVRVKFVGLVCTILLASSKTLTVYTRVFERSVRGGKVEVVTVTAAADHRIALRTYGEFLKTR